MSRPSLRLTVPVAMLAVGVLVAVVAVRAADDPDARAAYAEYLVARDATGNAREATAKAKMLIDLSAPADRLAAERVYADAATAAGEAETHANRLHARWADRWRGLGLVP